MSRVSSSIERIIRKTRTVMECLHRFCRECIDKSMRLGNNECPACRTHCASRRSLRDDPNYDTLIAALYPDIDQYEEEELAFHEEEKTRNKQIQASIAQTLRRQEAISRRRTTAKATAAAFVRRSSYRNLRGRRNCRGTELQGSDDDEDANGNGSKYSSSAEERSADVKQRRCKRWTGVRFSHPSMASANADGGCDENDMDMSRENTGTTPGLVGNHEGLVWGRGGTRSHTRHGSTNGGNGKHARSSRICKLADYFRSLEENDNELEIQLMVASLDEQRIPSLEQRYLCCSPTLSVRHLCQYVALQTPVQAEELEILVVKGPRYGTTDQLGSTVDPLTSSTDEPIPKSRLFDPCKNELQILEGHETVAALQANCNTKQGLLVLAYRHKVKR